MSPGKVNDGGPAYPVTSDAPVRTHNMGFSGMSLRDYFAAAALTGMLSNTHLTPSTVDRVNMEVVWRMADAMLAARDNQPEQHQPVCGSCGRDTAGDGDCYGCAADKAWTVLRWYADEGNYHDGEAQEDGQTGAAYPQAMPKVMADGGYRARGIVGPADLTDAAARDADLSDEAAIFSRLKDFHKRACEALKLGDRRRVEVAVGELHEQNAALVNETKELRDRVGYLSIVLKRERHELLDRGSIHTAELDALKQQNAALVKALRETASIARNSSGLLLGEGMGRILATATAALAAVEREGGKP